MVLRTTAVLAAALLVGAVSAKLLPGAVALTAIPWGVLALLTPLLAGNRREARNLGAAFGFAVSASYLWSANTDPETLAHLELLVPAIVVASLFGLLCGWGLAWLGWRARRRLDVQSLPADERGDRAGGRRH